MKRNKTIGEHDDVVQKLIMSQDVQSCQTCQCLIFTFKAHEVVDYRSAHTHPRTYYCARCKPDFDEIRIKDGRTVYLSHEAREVIPGESDSGLGPHK